MSEKRGSYEQYGFGGRSKHQDEDSTPPGVVIARQSIACDRLRSGGCPNRLSYSGDGVWTMLQDSTGGPNPGRRFSMAAHCFTGIATLIFLSHCIPAKAQETGGTIRVDVQQVIVPVVVVDKKANHVTGLTKDDFEVQEDGIAQSIVSFSGPRQLSSENKSFRRAVHSPVDPDRTGVESPSETYLLVVDALHSSFGNFSHIRDSLRGFLERDSDPLDEYGLVTLGRVLTIQQQYTRDTTQLLAVLRSRNFPASLENAEMQGLEADATQLRRMVERYCQDCPCGALAPQGSELRKGVDPKCVDKKQGLRQFVSASAERTRIITEYFLSQMQMLITQLSQLPRRRVLVLFSDGFTLIPGRELYGILAAYFPKDSEWQIPAVEMEREIEPLLVRASEHNVVISCIDSRGVYYSPPGDMGGFEGNSYGSAARGGGSRATELQRQAASIAIENTGVMEELARASGGLFVSNSNNLRDQLRRVIEDGRQYYVLVYAPATQHHDGKYHSITVHVNRPGLSVRAKAGYWSDR